MRKPIGAKVGRAWFSMTIFDVSLNSQVECDVPYFGNVVDKRSSHTCRAACSVLDVGGTVYGYSFVT